MFIRECGTLQARVGAGFTSERTRYGCAWLKFALWQGHPRPDNASITGLVVLCCLFWPSLHSLTLVACCLSF